MSCDCFPSASFCCPFRPPQRPTGDSSILGARAASLGGAFTVVAAAYYWNPAGLAFGPIVQVGWSHGEHDLDLSTAGLLLDTVTGLSVGYLFMGVAGTWFTNTSSRREGDVLSSQGLETFDFAFSLLQSLPIDDLVIAGNIHYLRGTAFELDEMVTGLSSVALEPSAIFSRVRGVEGQSSHTRAIDLAALYEPNSWLRVGLMWRRLNEPEFGAPSGSAIVLSRHARAGAAFHARDFSGSGEGVFRTPSLRPRWHSRRGRLRSRQKPRLQSGCGRENPISPRRVCLPCGGH